MFLKTIIHVCDHQRLRLASASQFNPHLVLYESPKISMLLWRTAKTKISLILVFAGRTYAKGRFLKLQLTNICMVVITINISKASIVIDVCL